MDTTLAHKRAMETRGLPAVSFCGGLRAKTVFDIIPDGISIQDEDYNIIMANHSFANMSDIPVEELAGRRCYEVYYGREEVCTFCPLIETQQTNNLIIKQGSTYEVHAYPLIDNEGNVQAVLGYTRDITRRDEMQSQLNQAEEIAELGRLVGVMTHEVKNPLAIIQMSIDYLSNQLDTNAPRIKKHLQAIHEEIERANRIIQDIAVYAKPPALHYERINVNTQVRLALARALMELDGKNIEVINNIDKNPITAEMDKAHLQQILQNLLKNACQAMPAGGRLTVFTSYGKTSQAKGEFAEIKISDTGGGIAEEKIEKIFEPFFTTKRDGMGLGLYISRRLVERYQGEIVAQSREGEGTTFVVRLPLKAEEKETSSVCYAKANERPLRS